MGILKNTQDFKAPGAVKEHTTEVRGGGRDPGVKRPGAGLGMATPADRLHTATGLGARSSNQQRGRGVYASCLWPTMQCWGFLEGA